MAQYIIKRQFVFFYYTQNLIQISRGSIDDMTLKVIDKHSAIFLCTILRRPRRVFFFA